MIQKTQGLHVSIFDEDDDGVDQNHRVMIGSEFDEDAPPVKDETSIQKGQIYTLGDNHRVMCGDSTSIPDVKKLLDGKQIDLLVTDPPYNVAYVGKTKDALTIQNDKKDDASFRAFLRDAFKAADSVMREGAGFYIWHASSAALEFLQAMRDVEWKDRQCLIWAKNTMVLSRQDYHWKHEPCYYGWKDGAAHYWGNDRKQTTVIGCKKPARNADHPTSKPVELIQYQVTNSSKVGDRVLDLFGGSGSTMVACEKSERKSYTMELDPIYCQVIIDRWETLTGKKATLVS